MPPHHLLLQLRPLKPNKELVMKSKTLFYDLILITILASLIPAAHAQTFSVIHTFTGGLDGGAPYAGVTIKGNALYGTGSLQCGSVYQLTHNGSNWLFSTLAALGQDCGPMARVVFGPDDHLYGTTAGGGPYYGGTVFKVTPQVAPCRDAACYWTVNDLYAFGSSQTDANGPGYGDLIWDQQGNIYGTTNFGGAYGNGAVYQLTPSGNGYIESILYSFQGTPGAAVPYAGLVFDKNGNLFGTTAGGGAYGNGAVFELTYAPGVGWTEHVLYNFQAADDGWDPLAGLTFDSAGNLYGATFGGDDYNSGTVFELSPSDDTWTYKLLYSFPGSNWQNCGPAENLTLDAAGNLYGTTWCDGAYNFGNVFKLSNTENGWVYTSLYDFTGGSDGAQADCNVSIDTDGTLYGTTNNGGDYGNGTVWMIQGAAKPGVAHSPDRK